MIEQVLSEIKTIMIANLSTKIAEVNVEMADGILLEDIREENIFMSEKQSIQNYPAMIIVADATGVEDAVSGLKNLNHDVILECAAVDTNEERLTKKMYRYLEAVRRVIEQNTTLNGKVMEIIPRKYQYSPVFSKRGQFLKGFTIRFITIERQTYA